MGGFIPTRHPNSATITPRAQVGGARPPGVSDHPPHFLGFRKPVHHARLRPSLGFTAAAMSATSRPACFLIRILGRWNSGGELRHLGQLVRAAQWRSTSLVAFSRGSRSRRTEARRRAREEARDGLRAADLRRGAEPRRRALPRRDRPPDRLHRAAHGRRRGPVRGQRPALGPRPARRAARAGRAHRPLAAGRPRRGDRRGLSRRPGHAPRSRAARQALGRPRQGIAEELRRAGRAADRGLRREAGRATAEPSSGCSEFDAFADPLRKKAFLRLQDLGAARLARGLRPGELGGLRPTTS